ncbi:NAD-dependent epimerase/dehydratase family protein [Myxococcota bacterium]|nr:NAD-dependent epimerase/dehydratase family protein [Myxococcota bacterium]
MKVFVTGGTGFLGRKVVEECLARGHAVRAMVRDKRGARLPDGAELVEVGFGDRDALAKALEGTEAILHLAGKVSRSPRDASEMHWIHVEATQKLIDAAKSVGIRRLVVASTSGTIAVSAEGGRIANESDNAPLELVGKWPYYMSKVLQEKELLKRTEKGDVDAVILNPSLLLGPGDDRMSSVGDVLNVLNGRVPAITGGTAAIVDVRDCAPAFVHALERGRKGQRYILNGANMSVRTFFERIARAGDVGMPKLKLPSEWARTSAKFLEGLYHVVDRTPPVEAAAVDIGTHHWGCDASLAKRELGFTARDPQETIADTVRDLERRGLFRRV